MTHNPRLATKAYASIGIQTRGAEQDQYELAMLMFEAVLGHVAAARGAIDSGNVPTKAQNLHKAVRILQDGLRTSLDLDNGGELAQNLAHLYDYCVLRLTQANAKNDAQALAEVADLIKPVADAWRSIRPEPQAAQNGHAPARSGAHQAPNPPPPSTPRRVVGKLYGSPGVALSGA